MSTYSALHCIHVPPQMIKRTEGVSSTDIVGRMLMCVRDANRVSEDSEAHRLARQFSGHERDQQDSRTAISRWVVCVFVCVGVCACIILCICHLISMPMGPCGYGHT